MTTKMKIVIASNNTDKINEVRYLLPQYKILSPADLKCYSNPVEDGKSFAENAVIKIKALRQHTELPIIADDSGLCIDQLHGDPGIYSARWMTNELSGEIQAKYGFDKIYQLLLTDSSSSQSWAACFICVIALSESSDTEPMIFEGKLMGHVVHPPRGTNGFGYEPIFQPLNSNKTLGELSFEEKQKISHRALALLQLKLYLQKLSSKLI